MKVDYNFLANAELEEIQPYINFFNSFGYLKICSALSTKLAKECKMEYINIYERTTGKRWRDLLRTGVQFFIPNFYEESELFLRQVLLSKIFPIAKRFAHGKAIYLGSDGSCFNGQSFQWHRDWFTRSRMLKFNIYFNSNKHFGGRHLIIPGTQFTSDEYSQSIGRGGAWPFQPTTDGWLNENNYFPRTPSPRQNTWRTKVQKLAGRNFLPYIGIKPSPCDIVLFDQRTWHMVEKPWPSIPQLLGTALFAVHPEESKKGVKTISHKESFLGANCQYSELDELCALYVGERKMIKCANYGSYFEKLPSDLLHFQASSQISELTDLKELNVNLSDNSYSINVGNLINHYQHIGKQARIENPSLKDGYTDLMLGINFSNICNYDGQFSRSNFNLYQ